MALHLNEDNMPRQARKRKERPNSSITLRPGTLKSSSRRKRLTQAGTKSSTGRRAVGKPPAGRRNTAVRPGTKPAGKGASKSPSNKPLTAQERRMLQSLQRRARRQVRRR